MNIKPLLFYIAGVFFVVKTTEIKLKIRYNLFIALNDIV